MQNRELWSALGIVYLNTIAHPKCRCSSYFSCSICYETTRYDATMKRKRSSVRYIIISFVCSLRFVPPSFLHRIPLARLFETEQPCGGSCQNSSRPVKTMMFMPKGLLPFPPAFCFPVFLASHHVFFLLLLPLSHSFIPDSIYKGKPSSSQSSICNDSPPSLFVFLLVFGFAGSQFEVILAK